MSRSVYNVVKGPIGWSVFCDRVRLGGVYGAKGLLWKRPRLRRQSRSGMVMAFRSTGGTRAEGNRHR
jgi:hypothetical protein